MTFSFRINYPERGAFDGSAICIGGGVGVRARGRLSTCTKTPQNEVHAPALFASVPFLPLPLARPLVARSRLLQLLSRPFSSIVVIGNTLRRLASVLLLRQSQSPRLSHEHRLIESVGEITAPRSLSHCLHRASRVCQDFARGQANSLQVVVSSVVVARASHEQHSTTGKIPNDGKPTAQSRNLTARDGNNAC